MDRSNLLIGAGVLLGLGTLAYWLLNREGGTAASQPMTAADKARAYAAAVKAGFGQRRKMMFKLLAGLWPREAVASAFSTAGIEVTERAERVSREQFIELARVLSSTPMNPGG